MTATPRTIIRTDLDGFTSAASAYPTAVRGGDFVFLTGQVAVDARGALVGGDDPGAQTTQILRRIAEILVAEGGDLGSLVTTTAYLTDAAYAPAFNAAWTEMVGTERPARATVVADLLQPGLLVEVQATAYLPRG